jgi:hypothetical protein
MLRATLHDSDDVLVMKLEGCLAGPWVSEAYRAWLEMGRTRNGRPVHVDLRGICHLDDEGRKLLALMHLDGAEFMTSGCVLPEIVREVSERADAGYSFVWRK